MSSWNGASGDWGDGALWTPTGEPTTGSSAGIGASGAFTLTFETGDIAVLANAYGYNSAATFAMSGGTFATQGWTDYGSFALSGGLFYVAALDPDWSGQASQTAGVLDLQTSYGYGAAFYDGLQQSGGTINVLEGLLKLDAGSYLDGTMQGPGGGLYIAQDAALTLGNAATITTALLDLYQEGELVLAPGAAGVQDYTYDGALEAGFSSTLNSQGQDFTLGSAGEAYFAGSFTGGGVFDVLGEADLGGMYVTGDGTSVWVEGNDYQDNQEINIGYVSADQTALTIQQGGTLTNLGGGEITGNANGALVILGNFAIDSPGVDGATSVHVQTLDLSGTIEIAGILDLTGPENGAQAILAGLVAGPGELEIGDFETAVIGGIVINSDLTEGNTTLDVASLDVAYGGELVLVTNQTYSGDFLYGQGTLNTNGWVFTLGAAATGNLGNIIDGGGTVDVASTIGSMLAFGPTLEGQGTELLITGDANAGEGDGPGYFYLGQYGVTYETELSIASTGTLNMSIAGGVQGYGQAVLVNAGLLETSATPSYSGPEFSGLNFSNTGTIDIATGYAELNLDTATLGGLIEGPGELYLSGGTISLATGLQLDSGSLLWAGSQILLEADLSYGGVLQEGLGGTFNLQGYKLTLASGALDEVFTGSGTIITQGVIDGGPAGYGIGIWLDGAGTTLIDEYQIIQDNKDLALGEYPGESGILSIASGALYDITDVSGIHSGGTAGDNIINQGMFEEDNIFPLFSPVIGSNFVSADNFNNKGTIADAAGVLPITATLINDGLVTVSDEVEIYGAVFSDPGDSGNFVIGQGAELAFTGAFLVNPAYDGAVAASQTISFAGDAGTLLIESPQLFAGTILGFAPGDIISVDAPFDAPGYPELFGYADGILTLLTVIYPNTTMAETIAIATLAIPGLTNTELADLQLIYDNITGGTDIVIANNPVGPAPIITGSVLNSTWDGPAGANWNNGADWSTEYIDPTAQTNPQIENVVPFQGYAIILPASLALAYDAASTPTGEFTANNISGPAASTLDISGGTLASSYGIEDQGLVSISAGTLELISGFDYDYIATVSLTGTGVLRVDDGDAVIGNNGSSYYRTSNSINGTLTGAGEVVLGESGTFALGAADVLAVNVLANAGDSVLQGNQVFQGATFINEYLLNLNGYDFLAPVGTASELPYGTITGGGTFELAGVGDLGGSVTGSGTELLVTGTAYNGAGSENLSGGAILSIGVTGTLFNPVISGGTGTLINDGLIVETTGYIPYDEVGLIEQVSQFYDNTGSELDIQAGNMAFYEGTATFAGSIYGGGMLDLEAEIATLAASADLNVANFELYATTLTLEQSFIYAGNFSQYFGTLNTNGETLGLGNNEALATGTLDGAISGGGLVIVNGDYFASGLGLTGDGTELIDDGYIAIGGGFSNGFANGDATVFSVAAAGELAFYGPDNVISQGYGNNIFINSGLMQLSETGNNILETNTFINTGAINLPYSQLEIEANHGTLGGQITGPGELYLSEEGYSGGTFLLAPELELTVGTLFFQNGDFQLESNLTYAGEFQEFNPTLDNNGFGFDLTGYGILAGTLIGDGVVTLAGSFQAAATYLWGAQTTLDVTGTLQLGTDGLYAGSQNTAAGEGAILQIGTGGVLNLAADSDLGAAYSYSNFTLDNAGLIEKTADFGITEINATSFLNTGTIAALQGEIDISGALVNDGTLFEDHFGELYASTITGTGVIIIDPATTTLSSAVGAGQHISFAGAGGTLVLTDATQFAGTITGFGADDFIDISNVATSAITSETYSEGTLTVIESGGTINLAFASPVPGNLTLSNDGASGTVIEQAICYLHGTRILTANGEMPVEQLAIGDLVVSRRAGLRRIHWLGRQAYDPRFIQNSRGKIPVKISAGALGNGLPQRDLYVSPGHSMLLGETLVLARNLVNGVTITQLPPKDLVRYVQIEFEDHDCVLAEGSWSESYADAPGLRAQFHNEAEYWQLYPGALARECLELCAPRPEAGEALTAALAPIVACAASRVTPGPLEGWLDVARPDLLSGWALDTAHPELPVWLEIWQDERLIGRVLACEHRGDLAEAGKGQGRCAFNFASGEPLEAAALRITRAGTSEFLPMTQRCEEESGAFWSRFAPPEPAPFWVLGTRVLKPSRS